MLKRVLLVSLLIAIAGMSFTMSRQRANPAVLSARAPVSFDSPAGLPDPNVILQLVNRQRAQKGLPPLAANALLADIAQDRANDMARHNYYGHRSPNGKYFTNLLAEKRLQASYACENLDLSFTDMPESYVRDWLVSKRGHRECLLHADITEAGYAVTVLPTVQTNNAHTPYVIVAIHSTAL